MAVSSGRPVQAPIVDADRAGAARPRGGTSCSSSSLTWVVIIAALGLVICRDRQRRPGLHHRVGPVHPRRRRLTDLHLRRLDHPGHDPGRHRRPRAPVDEPVHQRRRLAVRLARPRHAAARPDLLRLLRPAPDGHRARPASRPASSPWRFNYGAYMTEIFRAGIQAVPTGQREAAQALGMPERLIMRRIVLPQAVRIVIPAIGNDFIVDDQGQLAGLRHRPPGAAVAGQHGRAQQPSASSRRCSSRPLVYWVLTIIFSYFQAAARAAHGQGATADGARRGRGLGAAASRSTSAATTCCAAWTWTSASTRR